MGILYSVITTESETTTLYGKPLNCRLRRDSKSQSLPFILPFSCPSSFLFDRVHILVLCLLSTFFQLLTCFFSYRSIINQTTHGIQARLLEVKKLEPFIKTKLIDKLWEPASLVKFMYLNNTSKSKLMFFSQCFLVLKIFNHTYSLHGILIIL